MKNTDNPDGCCPQQEVAHVYLAVLMASVVPALVFAAFTVSIPGFLCALIVTLAHTALFGVPLYLVLKRRNRVTWFNCLMGGLVIGLLPALMLCLAIGRFNGIEDIFPVFGSAGGLGAVGGIVGWCVMQSKLLCLGKEND